MSADGVVIRPSRETDIAADRRDLPAPRPPRARVLRGGSARARRARIPPARRFSPAACLIWSPSGRAECSDTVMPARTGRARPIGSRSKNSIYIDAAEVGRGIGRALLAALLDRCTELGYRQMVAVIGGSDTWPSIRLHEALGFTRAGLLPAVGFKFGRWVDIVLMQRALGPGATTAAGLQMSSIKGGESMAEAFADPSRDHRVSRPHLLRAGDAPDRRAAAGRASASDFRRLGSGAGMTSRSDRIRSRCIRSPSRSKSSRELVPWLMLNREGLNVLVHPLTDDSVADHTRFAVWLGTPLPLRVDVLRR